METDRSYNQKRRKFLRKFVGLSGAGLAGMTIPSEAVERLRTTAPTGPCDFLRISPDPEQQIYRPLQQIAVKTDPMEGSEGLNEIVLGPHKGGLVLSSGIYLVRVNSVGKPSSGKVFINP